MVKYEAWYKPFEIKPLKGWMAYMWTRDTYFGGHYSYKTEDEAKEAVHKFLARCKEKYGEP